MEPRLKVTKEYHPTAIKPATYRLYVYDILIDFDTDYEFIMYKYEKIKRRIIYNNIDNSYDKNNYKQILLL